MSLQIADFETNIDQNVKLRGRQYFLSGAVGVVARDGNTHSAFVSGTRDYHSMAAVKKGEILDWSCECPYDLSPMCKHVAALLFAVRENGKDKNEAKRKTAAQETVPSEEERVHALADKALAWISNKREPPGVYYQDGDFPASYTEEQWQWSDSIAARRKEHKNYIREDLEKYKRRQYYYEQAMDATDNARNVFDWGEEAEYTGEPQSAIACYTAVIETLVPALQNFDDSNAELGDPIRGAWEGLFRIANTHPPEPVSTELFAYALKEIPKDKYAGWDDPWEFARLAAELARDETDEKRLLAVAKSIIPRTEYKSWSDYQYDQYVALKIRLAERLRGDAAVEQVIEEESGNKVAYGTALARAYNRGDHEQVTKIATIAEQTTDNAPGLVSAYRRIHISDALRRGDSDSAVYIATQLVTDDWREGELWYALVQKYTPADAWVHVRKKVLAELDYQTHKRILLKEHALDELAELLARNPEDVLKHKLLLIETYPDLVRSACHNLIEQKVTHTGSREHYREIIGHLKTLASLSTQDTEVARAFATTWRTKYKLRRNLLAELSSAGFE